MKLPALKGPKRTVAVGSFANLGSWAAKYGQWDVGGGLAAMLATALRDSGQFVVVERATLNEVFDEQEIKAAGVSNPETGPELGRITGADYLVQGAVTEFGLEDRGRGLSVGMLGVGDLGGGLGVQTKSGVVAMDFRIVDTSTTSIVESFNLRKEISATGLDVAVMYDDFSLGSNEFWKSPLGAAAREMVGAAAGRVGKALQDREWNARVVGFDGPSLCINAGRERGVTTEHAFVVERVSRRFTDPSTGEVLGTRKQQLGTLQLTDIEERMSCGVFRGTDDSIPGRGDLVRLH